jgi:hypothetical protein
VNTPKLEIPDESVFSDFTPIAQQPNGRVQGDEELRGRASPIEPCRGADTKRIGEEKADERPEDPKSPGFVVRGIRSLRFGRTGFGSFLAHVRSLAGAFWFGKEFVVESANGCRMRNENGGPVDVCLAHAATEQKDPRHSALTGRYVGLHQPALTAYWPGVRRSFGLDGESVK